MRQAVAAAGLLVLLAACVPAARAGAPAEKNTPARRLAEAHAEARKATEEYKQNLAKLLSIYEAQREEASARVARIEQLFKDLIVSRRELEQAQAAVADLDAKIAGVRAQTTEADATLAEILAAPTFYVPSRGRRAPLRSLGAGSWSLANASVVQSFFQGRFGRSLPVSAYGQTETHNRLGWNHTNAVDVAVNPDSAEGQALVAFLREKGIPFLAFRSAIPGVATGPHIHIGLPSNRF
jgi:hypothetical protein